jgi:hypothetical protein
VVNGMKFRRCGWLRGGMCGVRERKLLARHVDLRGCATIQSGGGLCGMIFLVSLQTRYLHPTADNG